MIGPGAPVSEEDLHAPMDVRRPELAAGISTARRAASGAGSLLSPSGVCCRTR